MLQPEGSDDVGNYPDGEQPEAQVAAEQESDGEEPPKRSRYEDSEEEEDDEEEEDEDVVDDRGKKRVKVRFCPMDILQFLILLPAPSQTTCCQPVRRR